MSPVNDLPTRPSVQAMIFSLTGGGALLKVPLAKLTTRTVSILHPNPHVIGDEFALRVSCKDDTTKWVCCRVIRAKLLAPDLFCIHAEITGIMQPDQIPMEIEIAEQVNRIHESPPS